MKGNPKGKEKFIEQAKEIFGDAYDYSDFVYVNNKTNGVIHCNGCGRDFEKSPVNHLFLKQGCPYCSSKRTKPYTTEEAIEKAKLIHGDKYNYSRFEYVRENVKSCIICPEHGEFWQTPNKHIIRMHGCPKCAANAEVTYDEFVRRANAQFGNNVEYDEKDYHGFNKPFMAFCHTHGWFETKPNIHLLGKYGCPKCASINRGLNNRLSYDEFLKRAIEVHGNKYEYDESSYTTCTNKMRIICPEHGEFWQSPHKHAYCGHGCPVCSESKLECEVRQFLYTTGKLYVSQASKKDLVFLGKMSLDFYLPQMNVAIECQGRQHFDEMGFFDHEKVKERDERKYKLCSDNGVDLLYFTNNRKWYDMLPFYRDKNTYSTIKELKEKLDSYETGDKEKKLHEAISCQHQGEDGDDH